MTTVVFNCCDPCRDGRCGQDCGHGELDQKAMDAAEVSSHEYCFCTVTQSPTCTCPRYTAPGFAGFSIHVKRGCAVHCPEPAPTLTASRRIVSSIYVVATCEPSAREAVIANLGDGKSGIDGARCFLKHEDADAHLARSSPALGLSLFVLDIPGPEPQ
jgi:hypothetical protein